MLHYETIHPDTLELLRKIQSLEMFKDARLVGGTALALQLGHRKSVDLDFFGNVDASLQEITLELSTFASEKIAYSNVFIMRWEKNNSNN